MQGHAGGGEVLELRLGEQQHTRILADARDGEPLCPEPVAAYVAVYSCKGSHEQIARAGAAPEQPREGGAPEQLETGRRARRCRGVPPTVREALLELRERPPDDRR